MRTLLQSIVLPIAVAFLTTLAVEYLAKPRLEARKLRIIHSRTQIDELVYCFQQIGLLSGALPSASQIHDEPQLGNYASDTLARLDTLITETAHALSRLSSRYVDKHREHIRLTASFLGILQGRCRRVVADPSDLGSQIDLVKETADNLNLFDVYYRVHLGLRDSQEPWIKRLYWKRTEAAEYKQAANRYLVAQRSRRGEDNA